MQVPRWYPRSPDSFAQVSGLGTISLGVLGGYYGSTGGTGEPDIQRSSDACEYFPVRARERSLGN